MATAPQAIYGLFDLIHARIPEAVLSGIVGDVHHSFGYHLARNELSAGDYSVQLELDRQGDAGSASALDVSLNAALMKTVTGRLVAAAKARDPRLTALREFCGTLNGTETYPWDLSTNSSEGVNSWDDSHLWHVHLSFYRAYANNAAMLAPIADVMAGLSAATIPEGDDMATILLVDPKDCARHRQTWPGYFLLCGRAYTHIATSSTLAAYRRRYPAVTITYTDHVALEAGAK